MAVIILRAVPLLMSGTALVIWLLEYRRYRRPSTTAICLALVCLCLALIAQLSFDAINQVSPVPGLAHFLMHLFGLLSAFFLSAFALRLGQHEAVAARTVWRRALLLLLAIGALTTFYIIGPARAGLDRIVAEADAPFVAHYTAVFAVYLGMALIEVAWMAWWGAPSLDVWVRRGLRMLGWGASAGLSYAALRVFTPILAVAGVQLPFDNAGPGGVGTYLMLLGVLLMTIGILLPPVGTWWERRTEGIDVQRDQEETP